MEVKTMRFLISQLPIFHDVSKGLSSSLILCISRFDYILLLVKESRKWGNKKIPKIRDFLIVWELPLLTSGHFALAFALEAGLKIEFALAGF